MLKPKSTAKYLATLIRSSEAERAEAGRLRAAFLRHPAQDALEHASSRSTSPPRTQSTTPTALAFLDEVLGALELTAADAHAPGVYRYARGAALVVDVRPSAEWACLSPGSPPSALVVCVEEVVKRLYWGAPTVTTSWHTECMAFGRAAGGVGMAMWWITSTVPERVLFCLSMLLAHPCPNVAGRAARGDVARDAGAPGRGSTLHTTVASSYLCHERVPEVTQIISTMMLRGCTVVRLFHGVLCPDHDRTAAYIGYQKEFDIRSIQYLSDARGTQLVQRQRLTTYVFRFQLPAPVGERHVVWRGAVRNLLRPA
ncbi:hypothetical protein FB451DRAFT_1409508 [Mycena latifolia]|nr:hypothetical protein FB451DRAFT_1409508 [Mycena latifolia]